MSEHSELFLEKMILMKLMKKKLIQKDKEFAEELRCNNGNFLEIGLLPNNENLKDNFEITSKIERSNDKNTKIVDYSEQKIKLTTLTITFRAAKRIDRLLSLSNNNFLIVNIFPNLDVAFFKSLSINVAAYECWLKIIETGEIISEEQGHEIYQEKKKEENSLRKNILKQVYELVGYKSEEYYYIEEESLKYYPDPDNEESPKYYPDNEKESILPMDESLLFPPLPFFLLLSLLQSN
ncbi:hypothetical protein C1646_776434 [Rhizophagus diaphanus]|nr:hypothetical protein C1646_776434 [Rhizophagus diaphanus] [Rhizophagus sp. MUCL 43196]